MTRQATAVAHPNIALAKYWGKLPGAGNVPAVPSLSVTLAGMSTTTTVSFDENLVRDELVLNGVREVDSRALFRASELLDRVRVSAGVTARARVVSDNDFPTASGLASSASGFAALALAATKAADLDWSREQVAELARRSSASAARSLFDGFAELDGGVEDGIPSAGRARSVAPPSALDVRVLVCVTTEAPKSTSSTDGMRITQETSPYYAAWVSDAPLAHRQLREALLAGDFGRVGALAERSALAMHACAMAAGIVYVTGPTLDALAHVRVLRDRGLLVFATMDAGPHLKCLVRAADADAARTELARIVGVRRVLETTPGAGARILDASPERPR